jgi:hypothetical protein
MTPRGALCQFIILSDAEFGKNLCLTLKRSFDTNVCIKPEAIHEPREQKRPDKGTHP